MRAAVTGASGFLGRAICRAWVEHVGSVRAVVRDASKRRSLFDESRVEVIDAGTRDQEKWAGVDVVIHCAARAHVLRETVTNPLEEFRRVNRDATLEAARAAAAAGVRRFIFLSSIGVVGNRSLGMPLRETDVPNPQEPYAVSKWEAEQGLREIARDTDLEVVSLRLPLVHGPNPKGNLRKLLDAVEAHAVLPVGRAHNRRSFLGIDNLCSAMVAAAARRGSAYEVYHLADRGTLSTRGLVTLLAEELGRKPWLAPLPPWVARGGAALFGRSSIARRLFDDLEVDATAFMVATGWEPVVSLEAGMRTMAAAYSNRLLSGDVPDTAAGRSS